MTKHLLPTGIRTFREIRESNYYYVDKTGYALRLVEEAKHYFLSRPRRFGKSLFLDTLKELFEGNRELFKGLHIDDRWDWTVRHPVVRLDLSTVSGQVPGNLDAAVCEQLRGLESAAEVEPYTARAHWKLVNLLRTLHRRSGQRVVFLVDGCDKPVLDVLDQPAKARANHRYLSALYCVTKECDAHIRFSLLTGVSKFPNPGVFSGLNNLLDFSLTPAFSSICGFTEGELDTVFATELVGLDREKIRNWYSGYRWGGDETVYNPYDVLQLFGQREFEPWWFETDTPTFLVNTLVDRFVETPKLNGMLAGRGQIGTFDTERIGTEALLFQTGYLTVVGREKYGWEHLYRLGYPNRAVRVRLNESLLDTLTGDPSRRRADGLRLRRVLETSDFAGLERLLRSLLAAVPYEWHSSKEVADYEGYYASVVYSHLAASDLDVTNLDASDLNASLYDSERRGRLDMAVRAAGRVFLLEFKVQEQASADAAMAKLKERGYADKYRHLGEPIHLVAVEFSSQDQNLTLFEVEDA